MLFLAPLFPEIVTDILVVFTLVVGTALIMWMGELITQHGVGNGMSLIIFANIMAGLPQAIFSSTEATPVASSPW